MLKKSIFLTAILALAYTACYFIVISLSTADGIVMPLQPDAELYSQAARRICEGHPFSFSFGEQPSTGTTSVLHPFVLAPFYALGAHGHALFYVGFFLNALFYLVFLLGWTLAGWRWCSNDKVRCLFPIVLALAAQPVNCAFGQTDIGLWMALSGAFAAALAWKHWKVAALLTVAAPWVRPEGCVLAIALTIAALFSKEHRRQYLCLSVLALVSMISVFGFNWILTGRFQFDSVAHKGYFKTEPLSGAILKSSTDFLELVNSYLFMRSHKSPHQLFFIPILAGVFLWIGIVLQNWKSIWKSGQGVLFMSVLGSFALVSTSGWQGINYDRYLVWVIPVVFMLAAEGAVWVSELKHFRNVRYLPALLMIGYAMFGTITTLSFVSSSARKLAADFEFHALCESVMSQEDAAAKSSEPRSIGGLACGSAFFMGDRRFYHFSGLYSPDFLGYHKFNDFMELLKHRKDLRPFYLISEGIEGNINPQDRDSVLGRILALAPNSDTALRVPDWLAFDRGTIIPKPANHTNMIAHVDVGYCIDEKDFDYSVIDRWGFRPADPFVAVEKLNGETTVDGGRIIRGGDMMTVPLQPGRDCEVVVRTLSNRNGIEFNSPIKMLLNVDGADVGYAGYDLNLKTNAFQEVSFTIPGKAIRQTPTRVGFLGDHIVCGYWFFQ